MIDLAQLCRAVLRLAAAMALGLLLAAGASAYEAQDRARLDTLFAALRSAPDATTAQRIDAQIWRLWTTPSDPALAKRMSTIMAAEGMGDIRGAIALLDRLVTDYPTYAEGWNRRATMHYVDGNYEASIADCARVLELEPRHFGALSGRAMMYLQQGKRALALKDMATALAIHPYLGERQLFPELSRDVTRV